jgi:hypothetical protein
VAPPCRHPGAGATVPPPWRWCGRWRPRLDQVMFHLTGRV